MKKFREFIGEGFESPDAEHAEHVRNAKESQAKADAAGDKPHEYHSHMADHYEHLHKAVKHMIAKHPGDHAVQSVRRHVADEHSRKARLHREDAADHKKD